MIQGSSHKPAHSNAAALNPFARAMAEARGGQMDDSVLNSQPAGQHQSLPFGNGSGALSENDWGNMNPGSFDMEEMQRREAEKAKRERLRQQLHRQVNPVEARDVFNSRQQQVKKEIEQIRQELKLLGREILAFNKEIDLTLSTNVAEPGDQGKYYLVFFQKLREFIVLLRHKVQSARTWSTAMNSKKRRKKGAIGLEMKGQQHEQTATLFDQMHHERSTAYSGS